MKKFEKVKSTDFNKALHSVVYNILPNKLCLTLFQLLPRGQEKEDLLG